MINDDCEDDLLVELEDFIEKEFLDEITGYMGLDLGRIADEFEEREWMNLIALIKEKHGIKKGSVSAVDDVLLKKIKEHGAARWLKSVFGYGISRGMMAGYSRDLIIYRKVSGRLEG